MKIPLRLTPRRTREPATALLLPTNDAARLFDLVVQLGLDPLPKVYAVADGFLVVLPAPLSSAVAGVVRLRSLAEHLFLPTDAELTPPLLADEAQGLTRTRGLVFLPGQRVLGFAVHEPLAWHRLLTMPAPTATPWQPLPEPPTLALELNELTSSVPPPSAEMIVEQGRSDIGTESAQPGSTGGVGTQIIGTSLFVAGHLLAWLGTKLGLGGIAARGADLLQKALDKSPRLSKLLMNQQEAMLRWLLKSFQEGRIEEALRRALPLGGDAAGSNAATNAGLPQHSLLYSLSNLLAGRNVAASAWFTPNDLYYSLQAEYRKQAEEAARQGDYRRAAFIYAKLLNDLSGAARILSQGGLHRDAAVLYQGPLNNLREAAREWESAGEIDKAVEILVDQLRDHLAAAEVYRRVGANDRALHYYRKAADKLIAEDKDFEAGELYRDRAQRLDLALQAFADGWNRRPRVQALPCGLALADHYSCEPDVARFRQTVDAAVACVPDWPTDLAVRCVNQLARLAHRPKLAAIADEIQDRCLMALAAKMTESQLMQKAKYFPADSPWPTPLVRDAFYALDGAPKRSVAESRPKELVRLGRSTVRAIDHATLSGELFLGLEKGEILSYQPATGETHTISALKHPLFGLSIDPLGETLVVLALSSKGYLLVGHRSTNFAMTDILQFSAHRPTFLLGTFDNEKTHYFGLASGGQILLFDHDNPSWRSTFTPRPDNVPYAGFVGSFADAEPWVILIYPDQILVVKSTDAKSGCDIDLTTLPTNPRRSTLAGPPLMGWLSVPSSEEQMILRQRGMQKQWVVATIRWLNEAGELLGFSIDSMTMGAGNSPWKIATAKPVHGIQGSSDRRFSAAPVSLWDHIDDRFLENNPVAAFSQQDGTALIVNADGTVEQAPLSEALIQKAIR